MQKILVAPILVALTIVLTAAPVFAESAFFGPGGDTTSDVAWLYESPLTVYETIAPDGDGHWIYSYTFVNVDPAAIWMFGMFTTFGVLDILSSWDGYPSWIREGGQIMFVFDAYDGRNLDPDIAFIAGTYGPDFDDTNVPIPSGETVTGFTISSDEYDPSPKWYFYETVESGYAGDTGFVAAVGLTQGQPVAVETTTYGQVRALFD